MDILDEQCVCPVIYTTRLVPAKHTQPSPPSLSWLVLAASSRFPLDSLLLPYHPFHSSSQTSLNVALYPPSQSISQFLFNPLFHSFSLAHFFFNYIHTHPSSWKVGYPSSTTTLFVFGHLTGFCPHNPFPLPLLLQAATSSRAAIHFFPST